MQQRYDARGRIVHQTFEYKGELHTKTVCTYDGTAMQGTCVVTRKGRSEKEIRVTQFDAQGLAVSMRAYEGTRIAPQALSGREDYLWRSDRCPSIANIVRYGLDGLKIGRVDHECDRQGRLLRTRWFGTPFTFDAPEDPDRLEREVRYDYDDDRRLYEATTRARDGDGEADADGLKVVSMETSKYDEYGQVVEQRQSALTGTTQGDVQGPPRLTLHDYDCWTASGESSKGQPSIERAKAIKAKAGPMIKAIAGRWNFVADEGEKMVFLLDQGKLGIVERGQYDEVAATVIAAGDKTLTLSVSPPPGSDEAPLRFEVRLIDDASLVVSTPDAPEQKGRMYVR